MSQSASQDILLSELTVFGVETPVCAQQCPTNNFANDGKIPGPITVPNPNPYPCLPSQTRNPTTMNYYTSLNPEHYPGSYSSAGSYMTLVPGGSWTSADPISLPTIHIHHCYSRPTTIVITEDHHEEMEGTVEYHHFYGALNPYSSWPMHYTQCPLYYPYPGGYFPEQCLASEAGWPEGFVMKGELQWGKLGRVFGARRELPDFIQDDLRRVYGTYPKTTVTITYQNGEYLVKGEPRIGEQKYKVEKKVIRQAPTPQIASVSVKGNQDV